MKSSSRRSDTSAALGTLGDEPDVFAASQLIKQLRRLDIVFLPFLPPRRRRAAKRSLASKRAAPPVALMCARWQMELVIKSGDDVLAEWSDGTRATWTPAWTLRRNQTTLPLFPSPDTRHVAAAAAGRHLLPGGDRRRVHAGRAAPGGAALALQQRRRVPGGRQGDQPQVAGADLRHRGAAALPVHASAARGEQSFFPPARSILEFSNSFT